MEYSNDNIKQLIEERNALMQKYNSEIQKEIKKEKVKHKFSWKLFLLIVGTVLFMILAVKVNEKIFPKTSIWSWEYYLSKHDVSTK
jgi:hypothetical protein